MALDGLVESLAPYRRAPLWRHGYVAPFMIFYAIWIAIYSNFFGTEEYYELFFIGVAVIGVLQALAFLFCHWVVSIKCLLTLTPCKVFDDAELICVVPTANNGHSDVVPLCRTKFKGIQKKWFEFQKVHYVFDEAANNFKTIELDTALPFKYYQTRHGFESDEELEQARFQLGDNKMQMVVPEFMALFKERATAPFFVFQVFCVGLWCLEDMWYYSLFTLLMLVTFEATFVKQQMKNMSEIRNMGNKVHQLYAYRKRRWELIKSDELIPGDLISIVRPSTDNERTVPCDVMLIRGSCIVDESMLTGESVPQMKEPVETLEGNRVFDFEADSRLHVINGGTKVVQLSPPEKKGAGLKSPDNGCICQVLRTGFHTSQGKLLRTIMFGVKRVTANNFETFCFILFLLIFAIAASVYLWIVGSADERRNKYKLFVECTLILTSVIPPELPIELSLAVNASLFALHKLGIFCTEPFRIPFAGKIDICCFDKTGTLTTDKLVVEGIARNNDKDFGMAKTNADADVSAIMIMACCHSIVRFNNEIVGDPLEKACLEWADWNLSKDDTVVPKKGKLPGLRIFHRYHFASALKRMTVIAGYQKTGTRDSQHIVCVKGAPEVLRSMFTQLPADYDAAYERLALQGARVLAMGIRELDSFSAADVREKTRADFETDLTFAGFVVVSCPLKPDTKAMIKEIMESTHEVAMITGDNPLTACHVSKLLKFTKKRSRILLLDEPLDDHWKFVAIEKVQDDKERMMISLDEARTKIGKEWSTFVTQNEFCITGSAFAYLIESDLEFLRRLIIHIRVFSRMAPKQKERIVNELKFLGKTTLMCGDGTNDVGALKHAHVGVALLTNPFDAVKAAKVEEERERRVQEEQKNDYKWLPCANAYLPRENTPNAAQIKLDKLMAELEEEERCQIVRLGDASVAAPFTSKYTSLQSICHVIKQGRCTLVTTLQMFKILALNALVSAYSLSVLYLDGVKFSDYQATLQGLLIAGCFLFVSRSQPLKTLSRQRPLPTIFNAYTLLTVTLQFLVHFACLYHLVGLAHLADPRTEQIDLKATFSPNVLNTVVYIISMALQISTFAVNYRGKPFMESIFENTCLFMALSVVGSWIFLVAIGPADYINEQFELVKLPAALQATLAKAVVIDLVACYIVDRILGYTIGDRG